ncbi:MAG: CAP domain-containing protein [Pseudomonadota bacterium]
MRRLRVIILGSVLAGFAFASTASACSGPRLPSNANQPIDPKRINQKLFSEVVLAWTNYHRCKSRRSELENVRGLERAAASHSKNMAKYLILSHQTRVRGEQTLQKRYRKNGVRIKRGAENISQYFLYQTGRTRYLIRDINSCHFSRGGQRIPRHTYASLGKLAVTDWINSGAHRKNSLNRAYERSGAGLAVTYTNEKPCGIIYVAQNFAD